MENQFLDKKNSGTKHDKFFGENLHFYKELLFRPLDSLNHYGPQLYPLNRVPSTHLMPQDLLMDIEYSDNSHGYRSDEFIKKEELLILGCSQTYGHGMINEFTWPYLLSKKLNMNFARLAIGGDSLQGQVLKAFEYFRIYGNPKIIVGTFPLYRMEIPYVKDRIGVKGSNSTRIQQLQIPGGVRPKYVKIPYDSEVIVPREFAIFYNFIFIKILEQYCDSNNIKLIWNIWEDHHYFIYNYINNDNELKHILKNYCGGPQDSYNTFSVSEDIDLECHQEYREHILFNNAADITPNKNSHWGLHKHIHVAEEFYKKIML